VIVAVDHQADSARELESGVPVGGETAQELQRLGEVAGFDLTVREDQDDRGGDGGVEALGHCWAFGLGNCAHRTASGGVRFIEEHFESDPEVP